MLGESIRSDTRSAPTEERAPASSLISAFLRFEETLGRVIDFSVIVGVVVLTCILLAQVTSRYLLNLSLTWSEELARYLMVWVAFLGVSLGVRTGSHYGIDLIGDKISDRVLLLVYSLRYGATLLFFGLMFREGLVSVGASVGERSAALQLPMEYAYGVFPVVGLLALVGSIAHMIRTVPGWPKVLTSAIAAALIGGFLLGWISFPQAYCMPVFLTCAVVVLGCGAPIAVAIGLAAVFGIAGSGISPLQILTDQLFNAVNNFTLMAVPFFMLTGALLHSSGLADRLVDFAVVLVGRMRGGLAMVDVLASVLFADISGSSTSDTAAIGSTMIPGMIRKGYKPEFAVALQAASGSMGMLVPPSICTIVYATVAGVSVTAMFLSSFLPAALMAGSFMLIAYLHARRNNIPPGPRLPANEAFAALRRAILPLMTPIIILAGIFSGMFTPTEAGVVALTYTSVVGALTRGLTWSGARDAVVTGTRSSSMVFLVIGTATLLSWFLTFLQIPQIVAESLTAVSHNAVVILLLVMVLLVVMHTCVETVASILIVTPILLPVLVSVGVDPVHFGILILMNSALGLILPPLGLCLYIACAIGKVPIERATRAVLPFAFALVIDIVLIVVFPSITLMVPRLFGML